MCAVENLPFHAIPQFRKRTDDGVEGVAVVVGEQTLHVFKQYHFGFFGFNHSEEIKKQGSADVFESLSFATNGEGLTRESSAQEVEVWQCERVDVFDVSIVLVMREMKGVNRLCKAVDF